MGSAMAVEEILSGVETLTAREAAKRLGVDPATLSRWGTRGIRSPITGEYVLLRRIRLGGSVRYKLADLREFLEAIGN